MTMFWPDQKVALRIVDDVSGRDFDPRNYPDYQVVEVTSAQVMDYEQMSRIADRLCELLGEEPPEKTPEWLAANRRLHGSLSEGIRKKQH